MIEKSLTKLDLLKILLEKGHDADDAIRQAKLLMAYILGSD
jgi:DNA repair protein RadC